MSESGKTEKPEQFKKKKVFVFLKIKTKYSFYRHMTKIIQIKISVTKQVCCLHRVSEQLVRHLIAGRLLGKVYLLGRSQVTEND